MTGAGAIAGALSLADPDAARIAALHHAPAGEARAAALRELQVVCFAQLLAAMRRTVPESDFLPRAAARTVYEGMFDRAVAETLVEGDPLGLVARSGEGLKIPGGGADRPAGYRHEAAARGSRDEDR